MQNRKGDNDIVRLVSDGGLKMTKHILLLLEPFHLMTETYTNLIRRLCSKESIAQTPEYTESLE